MASRFTIKTIPSLRDFMTQAKVTALYRSAVRATRPLEGKDRLETISIIRNEFDSLRHLTDKDHINYSITTGKRRIDQFKSQLSMQR